MEDAGADVLEAEDPSSSLLSQVMAPSLQIVPAAVQRRSASLFSSFSKLTNIAHLGTLLPITQTIRNLTRTLDRRPLTAPQLPPLAHRRIQRSAFVFRSTALDSCHLLVVTKGEGVGASIVVTRQVLVRGGESGVGLRSGDGGAKEGEDGERKGKARGDHAGREGGGELGTEGAAC